MAATTSMAESLLILPAAAAHTPLAELEMTRVVKVAGDPPPLFSNNRTVLSPLHVWVNGHAREKRGARACCIHSAST